MSLVSFLLYVIANIILLVLLWVYHRIRQRQQMMHNNDTALQSVDDRFVSNINIPRYSVHHTLLAALGIHGHHANFSFEDHFSTFEDVIDACRRAGLEKCQFILGIDFSASNEWQGRKTFGGRCLHRIVPGKLLNPYQKVISIVGRTLESFDKDSYVPVFGFGDKQTHGEGVFPFTLDPRGCHGFAEVLERYERAASQVSLGGPTNFAPVIREAIDIVESRGTYHILIIIADGQVSEYGPTISAISDASNFPLSIVVVGVGDGPWDAMKHFDDQIPDRQFDNFQFVNYHEVTSKTKNVDATLALHVMMEIPGQYKAARSLGYLD